MKLNKFINIKKQKIQIPNNIDISTIALAFCFIHILVKYINKII